MKESAVETEVCAYAQREHDMLTYKFVSPGRRNVPDRMFVTQRGLIVFIEFKKKGENLRPGQKRELERLNERGCVTCVVDDVTGGKFLVDSMANEQQFIRDYHAEVARRVAAEERAAAIVVPAHLPRSRD